MMTPAHPKTESKKEPVMTEEHEELEVPGVLSEQIEKLKGVQVSDQQEMIDRIDRRLHANGEIDRVQQSRWLMVERRRETEREIEEK